MLFRTSSLALLLFISVTLLYVRDQAGAHGLPLRVGALVLCSALAAPAIAQEMLDPWIDEKRRLDQQSGLHEFARNTPQDAVFLIHPELDRSLLGFQRETGRSVPVLFKFLPSRSDALLEWYRRQEWQREIFRGDCARADEHRVGYLIVDPAAPEQGSAACGELVYRDKRFGVIRISASH